MFGLIERLLRAPALLRNALLAGFAGFAALLTSNRRK
jgi:hypothetical protein